MKANFAPVLVGPGRGPTAPRPHSDLLMSMISALPKDPELWLTLPPCLKVVLDGLQLPDCTA
jgi:hypothetical protein